MGMNSGSNAVSCFIGAKPLKIFFAAKVLRVGGAQLLLMSYKTGFFVHGILGNFSLVQSHDFNVHHLT